MHRHCIRSALSQCTEPACKSSVQVAQRLCFSTSSTTRSSTPKPPTNPSKYPKRVEAPRKKPAKAPHISEPTPGPRLKKILYWNAASSDPGYRQNVKLDKTAPTPAPFVNTEPLKAQLIKSETKAFVAGEEIETNQQPDVELEEELSLSANFTPGTFVEIRRNERVTEAIVLADILKDRSWRVVCLASSGEIIVALLTNIIFAVPNIISADLAKRCGREIVPETPQALNARVEALKQLRLVSIQAEQAAQGSRMWDRQKIANLYEEVKHHDPNQWTTVTLEHATALLYTQPGYINYYATHKYLMERPLRYIADTGYIRSQQFRVRPERDIKEIQQVETWITGYRFDLNAQTPYKLFIEKARRVVEIRRKVRIRKKGPMTQENASFSWTESDQVFLSFLLRAMQQHMTTQLDPYRMGRNAIVKDITRISEVTDDAIHELLISLGIIAPWQDLHALSPQLNPSTDFSAQFPIEKETETILRASSRPSSTTTHLGPLDFQPHDPLDSVRHDFGNLRVFVIDDPTAKELDDGISVERIPTEPENYWLHVHIADPARILHPKHALAVKAHEQFSAIYLGTGNYPMLPRTLMHDPQYGLSLTDSSATKDVNRVLTFSAKLDAQGNILDHKLRAGILRNVCKTTYDDVNLALGLQVPPRNYPFGGSPDFEPGPPLSASDVSDLRILKKLADMQVAKRVQTGVVVPERPYADVKFKTEFPTDIQSPSLAGSLYQGFPEMQYSVILATDDDQGARNIVSELMKLGCRIASRVALEHNVPIIRRSLQPFIWKSEEDLQKVLAMRNSQGYIPMQEFVKFDMFATTGYYTQEPDAHYQLGLPAGEGYSRATSPLRRYLDLVIHWQLHHILLGANAPPRPPFSSEDIEELIIEAGIRDIQIRRLQKANINFYALMYIKRFAEDTARGIKRPFGNPLARMKAWTLRQPVRDIMNSVSATVVLPELGIEAQLHHLPHHFMDLPPGSDLTVKMKAIELGLRRTKMIVELA